uniref:hypothetical protein n=1 Tax=Prevotella sp. TaxID=59823 RepID=UPI0025D94BAF|nr:hypothetical protein [Prevotella sp.]
MKKRYMCPMTTTIMAETCSICAGSLKWTERTESQDPEEEPSSWGEIIWDKGADTFKKEGEEDPFDSNNW